MKFALSAR